MRENIYARKLVFDRCVKINTREINQCPMREIINVQCVKLNPREN